MAVISFHYAFDEIVLLLLIAAAAGVAALRLKQPPIIGFIAAGILMGPSALNLIRSFDQIHLLAEMGLALLLFVVGLKLYLGMMRSMGSVSVVVGLSQIVFTTIGGFALAYGLGMSPLTSLYVAVALTFSSTIIIVKLLSDKNDIGSLHGRIALGLLIVQDIVIVFVMVLLSAFAGSEPRHPAYQIALVTVMGTAYIAAAWV